MPRVTWLSVVIRPLTCRSRRMSTSTRPAADSPAKPTFVTDPTSTPPTRTGAPGFSPFTSDIRALRL